MMKMVDVFQKVTSLQKLILLMLWVQQELTGVLASEKVYFDKYGHCIEDKPFDLGDDTYRIFHKGGGLFHENKDCSLSFKATLGYGVCMSFHSFSIDDCSVKLLTYESKDEKGDVWKTFTCHSGRPSRMCTSERYVTLRVRKDRLNDKKGYSFTIDVEQSSSVTDEGVVFASIGFVVGTIVGVVVFLILIAFVVYCCCRNKGEAVPTSTKHIMPIEQVQPSAPPLMDGEERVDFYPHQLHQETPMLDPPPPYEQPPSYSPQHS